LSRVLYIFFLLCSLTVVAQNTGKDADAFSYMHLRFDNLTLKDGLSSKDISFVVQDRRGLIWIGTRDGLNRFDGINIKIYRKSERGNSLPDNRLNSIVEDADGTLWLGTQGGISHFNPFSEVFENFVHDPANPASLSNNWDCNIFKDSKNRLWVMNNDGLHLLDRKSKGFSTRFNKIHNPFYCFEDEKGVFWLAAWNGITSYNPENGQSASLEKTNSVANCILKDSRKNWWFGAWDIGLCRLDSRTGTYKNIPLNLKKPAEKYNVFGLKEINQQVWISTNVGLFIIPVDEINRIQSLSEATHYQFESTNPYSLAGVASTGVFKDKQGTIWVSTDGGISRVFPSKQLFDKISVPNKALISEFFFDEKVNLIGGWGQNALIITDKKFTPLQTYQHFPPQLNKQANHAINAIIKDTDKYWIGTMNGLVHCDFKAKRFKVYQHDEKNTNSLGHRRVNALLKDSKGRLWVGLYDWGLDLYMPQTESFIHFTHNSKKTESLGDNLVWELVEDKKGQIWVLGNQCLSRFEETSHTFRNFRYEPNNPKSLSGQRLSSIFLDSKGRLWVGTDNGLNLFDEKTQRFFHWTTDDGLVSNNCTNIQEDNEGSIWIATANGLSKFDLKKQKFFNFTELDGLTGNILSGDFEKDKDGKFYIGYFERIDRISPEKVKTNTQAPKVLLTNLKVSDQEVHFDVPLEKIGDLSLPYYQNKFSCNFVAINYNNTAKNQYAYRLDGLEKNGIMWGANNWPVIRIYEKARIHCT
jgi:ligand-binding sensor domain-containing protein